MLEHLPRSPRFVRSTPWEARRPHRPGLLHRGIVRRRRLVEDREGLAILEAVQSVRELLRWARKELLHDLWFWVGRPYQEPDAGVADCHPLLPGMLGNGVSGGVCSITDSHVQVIPGRSSRAISHRGQ